MSCSIFSRHLRYAVLGSALIIGSAHALAQQTPVTARLVFYPAPLEPALNSSFSPPHAATNQQPAASRLTGTAGMDLNARPNSTAISSVYQAEIRRDIRKIEDQQGMFAEALSPTLVNLGQLLQQEGDHLKALEAFERAVQIDKFQTGLYSPQQIKLIRLQLESQKVLGDTQQIQDSLDRLVLMHQKYYGPTHTETAFAIQEVGNWKLDNFVLGLQFLPAISGVGLLNPGTMHNLHPAYAPLVVNLYEAQHSFISAITTVITNQDFSEPRLPQLEDKLIATYYLNTNREQLSHPAYSGGVTNTGRSVNPRTLPPDYFNGEAAYQRKLKYLRHDEKATLGQLSQTMLALADWYQLFQQFELASKQRSLLADTLREAGLHETTIAKLMLMDSPVVLPTFLATALSPRPFAKASVQGYVDLALHIDQWGQASSVETIATSAGTPDQVIQELSRLVRNARYRIESVEGSNSTIRYYYAYQ